MPHLGSGRHVIDGPAFVNPYTFVPFPSTPPHRQPPYGHDGTDPGRDLLTGQLVVTIKARTPILVRGFGTPENPEVPSRPQAGRSGREHIIPGSALHGATRSLHETLTGSCLRIFDDDFVPGYRHTVNDRGIADLRMGVVSAVSDGRPVTVQLCDDPVWSSRKPRLDQDVLSRLHLDGGLRSGDRLTVDVNADGKPVDARRDKNGDWVVFITDSGAREPKGRYRAHIRKLGSDNPAEVPEEVWRTYLAAVAGADDLRPARQEDVDPHDPFIDVVHPKNGDGPKVTVGQRHLARTTVRVGQPLWLRMSGSNTIDEIRLGMAWRRPGDIAAGCRVPDGFQACHKVNVLCPSCRLFGSADVRGNDTEAAQQNSYRGHVRFGDAIAISATVTGPFQLPPMGQPRPGAGQFYLSNPPEVVGMVDEPPLREWGSAADKPVPRALRGRKSYWHTSVAAGQLPARGKARPHHKDNEMAARAVAFDTGSTFEATLTFTDLDRAQLGGLLAALDPRLVLDGDVVQHIGGGRPLGYGSCSITVDTDRSWMTTPDHRYRGRQPVALTKAEQSRAIAEFRVATDQEIWPALEKALRMDAVRPEDVWYPPGAGKPGSDTYDQGFEFWKQTAGAALADDRGKPSGYPLTVLPDVMAEDQRLPIVAKAKQTTVSTQPPPGTGACQ